MGIVAFITDLVKVYKTVVILLDIKKVVAIFDRTRLRTEVVVLLRQGVDAGEDADCWDPFPV